MNNETYKIPIEQSEEDKRGAKLKITRRGKQVAALAVAGGLFAGGFAASEGLHAMADHDEAMSAPSGETIAVMPGDTLWGIATELAPTADPRDTIDLLEKANPQLNSALMPGDTISIPVGLAGYDSEKDGGKPQLGE